MIRGRSSWVALISLVVLVPMTANGQQAAAGSQPLRLDRVLAAVDRFHPLIHAARHKVGQAEGEVLQREGGFDPTLEAKGKWAPHGDYQNRMGKIMLSQPTPFWGVTLYGQWRISGGAFPDYEGGDITADGGELGGGIDLPLLQDGWIDRRRAVLRQSHVERQRAELDVLTLWVELGRRAGWAYWNWVAAGLRLRVDQRLYRIARERDAALRARVERGDLPSIEQVDNQRTILARKGALIASRRVFEKAAIALSLYYRDRNGRPVRPTEQMVPLSPSLQAAPPNSRLKADIQAAITRRPDLRALNLLLQLNAIDRELFANQRWPQLNLRAGAGVDLGDEPYRSERSELKLGLNFKLPIPMRAARGKLRKASARQREVAARRRYAQEQVEAQVRDAYSALSAAHQRAEVAREEQRVAHQVEQAERTRMDLGASSLLIVNLREQSAAEADRRAIDAATAYRRAWADYQAATAARLSGSQRTTP